MQLHDEAGQPKPRVPLPQLCYDVAYFILPHYAHNDLSKLIDMCQTPLGGPWYYVMACQMREIEPIMADARLFRWHRGQLSEGVEYFALEYPVPPPVDMSAVSPEEMMDNRFVLAPHFSAVLRDTATAEAAYFILGQAPIGGGTTLRCVTKDRANCNLGPGPEPDLAAFLDAIRQKRAAR